MKSGNIPAILMAALVGLPLLACVEEKQDAPVASAERPTSAAAFRFPPGLTQQVDANLPAECQAFAARPGEPPIRIEGRLLGQRFGYLNVGHSYFVQSLQHRADGDVLCAGRAVIAWNEGDNVVPGYRYSTVEVSRDGKLTVLWSLSTNVTGNFTTTIVPDGTGFKVTTAPPNSLKTRFFGSFAKVPHTEVPEEAGVPIDAKSLVGKWTAPWLRGDSLVLAIEKLGKSKGETPLEGTMKHPWDAIWALGAGAHPFFLSADGMTLVIRFGWGGGYTLRMTPRGTLRGEFSWRGGLNLVEFARS